MVARIVIGFFLTASMVVHAVHASGENSSGGYHLSPNEVWAEGPIYKHRLDHPDAHFLVDTYNGHITGEKFYQRPGRKRMFLWPQHEFHDYRSQFSRANRLDHRLFFSGHLGSEVGDPHIQELVHPLGSPNKTPLSYATASLSPREDLWVFAAIEQNDQFSMTTYDWRRSIIRRQDAPWFGGNIPTRSITDFGFRFTGAPLTVNAHGSFFWNWTVSPYSGAQIPWRGHHLNVESEYREKLGFEFEWQNWEDILVVSPEGRWRQGWARLYYKVPKFVGYPGWNLKTFIEWNGAEVDLSDSFSAAPESGPGFPSIRAEGFNRAHAGAQMAHHWTSPDSLRRLLSRAQVKLFDRSTHVDATTRWEEGKSWGLYFGNLRLFTENASDLGPDVSEIWGSPIGKEANYAPDFRQSGLLGEVGARITRSRLTLGGQIGGALEWGIPFFDEDTVFSFGKRSLFRSGQLRHFHESTASLFRIYEASWNASANTRMQVSYKQREFYVPAGHRLDFVPARHMVSWGVNTRFPSNLHLNLKSHWVGEKRVNGWDEASGTFIVPSHFEHNATLVQTFLQERIATHYSVLHAFGKEIREHPAGNPLRFRIDAGADFRF